MIYLYDIVREDTHLPSLYALKEFPWNAENSFTEESTIAFLNKELRVKDYDSEHAYIVAYDDAFHILGVYNANIGDYNSCNIYNRNAGIFLMLTGAVHFRIYHNHPNGVLLASDDDKLKAIALKTTGLVLGVCFDGSYIITKKGWIKIES